MASVEGHSTSNTPKFEVATTPKELGAILFTASGQQSETDAETEHLELIRSAILSGVSRAGPNADLGATKASILKQGESLLADRKITPEEFKEFEELVEMLTTDLLNVYLNEYGQFAIGELGKSVVKNNPDIKAEDFIAAIRQEATKTTDIVPNDFVRELILDALKGVDPDALLAHIKDNNDNSIVGGNQKSLEDQMVLLVGFYLRDLGTLPNDIETVRQGLTDLLGKLPASDNAQSLKALTAEIEKLEPSDLAAHWETYTKDILAGLLLYLAPKLQDKPEQLLPSIKEELNRALQSGDLTPEEQKSAITLLNETPLQELFAHAGISDQYVNFSSIATETDGTKDPAETSPPRTEEPLNWLLLGISSQVVRGDSPPQNLGEFTTQLLAAVDKLPDIDPATKTALKKEINSLENADLGMYLEFGQIDPTADDALQALLPLVIWGRDEIPSGADLRELFKEFVGQYKIGGALDDTQYASLMEKVNKIDASNSNNLVLNVALMILGRVSDIAEQAGATAEGVVPQMEILIEDAIKAGLISQVFGQALIATLKSGDEETVLAAINEYTPRTDIEILDPNAVPPQETKPKVTPPPADSEVLNPKPSHTTGTERVNKYTDSSIDGSKTSPVDEDKAQARRLEGAPPRIREEAVGPSVDEMRSQVPSDPPDVTLDPAMKTSDARRALAERLIQDPIFLQLIENRQNLIATQKYALHGLEQSLQNLPAVERDAIISKQQALHEKQLNSLDQLHEKIMPGYTDALELYQTQTLGGVKMTADHHYSMEKFCGTPPSDMTTAHGGSERAPPPPPQNRGRSWESSVGSVFASPH